MTISKKITLSLLAIVSCNHTWTKLHITPTKNINLVLTKSETHKIRSNFTNQAQEILRSLEEQLAGEEYKYGRSKQTQQLRKLINQLKTFVAHPELHVQAFAISNSASEKLADFITSKNGAQVPVKVINQINGEKTNSLKIIVQAPNVSEKLNLKITQYHLYKHLTDQGRLQFSTSKNAERKFSEKNQK